MIKKQAIDCFMVDVLPNQFARAIYDMNNNTTFLTLKRMSEDPEGGKYIYIGHAELSRAETQKLVLNTEELAMFAQRLLFEAAQLNPVVKSQNLVARFAEVDLVPSAYVEVDGVTLAVADPEFLGVHPIWTYGKRTENLMVCNIAGVVIVED